MRPHLQGAAAIVVACVFASLPTLVRLHDRLSSHDDVTSFRLSKNIERPHEKIGVVAPLNAATTLPTFPTIQLGPDVCCRGVVADPIASAVGDSVRSALLARAPPA